MMANSLTTATYATLSEELNASHNVTMLNPLSADLATMRQSLLFSGLEAVSYNINRKNADLKLFEFGKTKTQNVPSTSDVFSEGIAIAIGNDTLVELGVVKKSILKHFGIKQEVFYADFNWALILKLIATKIKYTEIPKYPEVRRDLALLIDQNVTYESIYTIAKQTEKALLKDINLFDVYEGQNLPEGKKSYALSFTIQDNSKTLTDTQIDKIMSKLQNNFETELGASLR